MICFFFCLVVFFFLFSIEIKNNAFLFLNLGYMICGQLKPGYVAKSLVPACCILCPNLNVGL